MKSFAFRVFYIKSKITKILNSEENLKRKIPNQRLNQKRKHIKRMDNNMNHIQTMHTFLRKFVNIYSYGLKKHLFARHISFSTEVVQLVVLSLL